MTESLIAPLARARFVVTLPPEPSQISQRLLDAAGKSFLSLTDTKDAFLHLAGRARDRLVILTPYIDFAGAFWAGELFEATKAKERILVLRELSQLTDCGAAGTRLRQSATKLYDYSLAGVREDGSTYVETFHAKVVLADGVAAYVGSANFLYRSREINLECGFLLEGDAVAPVTVLIEALLSMPKLAAASA